MQSGRSSTKSTRWQLPARTLYLWLLALMSCSDNGEDGGKHGRNREYLSTIYFGAVRWIIHSSARYRCSCLATPGTLKIQNSLHALTEKCSESSLDFRILRNAVRPVAQVIWNLRTQGQVQSPFCTSVTCSLRTQTGNDSGLTSTTIIGGRTSDSQKRTHRQTMLSESAWLHDS